MYEILFFESKEDESIKSFICIAISDEEAREEFKRVFPDFNVTGICKF